MDPDQNFFSAWKMMLSILFNNTESEGRHAKTPMLTMAGHSPLLHYKMLLLLLSLLFLIFALPVAAAKKLDVEGCEDIYVGAGWAGVYSFYRRVVDDPSRGPKSCLFEESWRVGGRTYSVHINHTTTTSNNLVQDVGAYRFSENMHLPGDLILHDLQLETECYEESCPTGFEMSFNQTTESDGKDAFDSPLRIIVDPTTRLPIGYVTPLWKMIEIAEGLGGRVFLQTSLVGMATENTNGEEELSLYFRTSNDTILTIRSPSVVVLNLPRHKLFDIEGVERSLEPEIVSILKCFDFQFPTNSSLFGGSPGRNRTAEKAFPTNLEKAYLYYEDAWWRTILHKPEGVWPVEFPAVPSESE